MHAWIRHLAAVVAVVVGLAGAAETVAKTVVVRGGGGVSRDGPLILKGGVKSGLAVIRPYIPPSPGSLRPAWLADCDKALSGDADAAFRMAQRQLYGEGYRRDPGGAAAWLRIAAQEGHAKGMEVVRYLPPESGGAKANCRPSGAMVHAAPPPPAALRQLVEGLAAEQGVDPALALAVVRAESGFVTTAVSPKAAAGLMQLIPATASRFAVANVFDPTDNVRGGIRYLRWLLSYYRGDVTLALAGYNAGEGAVDRYGGVPPYRETESYIAAIRQDYPAPWHPFDAALAAPSPVVQARALPDKAAGKAR